MKRQLQVVVCGALMAVVLGGIASADVLSVRDVQYTTANKPSQEDSGYRGCLRFYVRPV